MEFFKFRRERPREEPEAPKTDEQVDTVRRGLMQLLAIGGGMVAADKALGATIHSVPAPQEMYADARQSTRDTITSLNPEQAFLSAKQRILDDTIRVTLAMLKQKNVRDALRWKTKDPVTDILRAVELPILPAHLDGTSYDVTHLRNRYPLHIGIESSKDAQGKDHTEARIIPSTIQDPSRGKFPLPKYGNAFYWNDGHTIVTPKHVAEVLPNSGIKKEGRSDISVARVSERWAAGSPDQILHDDPTVTDEEVEGAFVAVVGKDPDALSDFDGGKVYPGIAVKMTPEFIRHLNENVVFKGGSEAKEWFMRNEENAFLLVLPPGEAKSYPRPEDDMPVAGMSGSPVFAFIRGQYRLAGVLIIGTTIFDFQHKREVSVGFFQPISQIRAAMAGPRWHLD